MSKNDLENKITNHLIEYNISSKIGLRPEAARSTAKLFMDYFQVDGMGQLSLRTNEGLGDFLESVRSSHPFLFCEKKAGDDGKSKLPPKEKIATMSAMDRLEWANRIEFEKKNAN